MATVNRLPVCGTIPASLSKGCPGAGLALLLVGCTLVRVFLAPHLAGERAE
jgi:hypothetical protein